MAKILIYSNFLQEGQESVLAYKESRNHQYTSIGPGRWQADPYGQTRQGTYKDVINRFMACLILWWRWRKYDVLILDSATNAFFICTFSLLWKGRRKLILSAFNIPRRRTGIWRFIGIILFNRIDHLFVHSRVDVEICRKIYCLSEKKVSFRPYIRSSPSEGQPNEKYFKDNTKPYILSVGSNGRDYETFMKAIEGTNLSAVVVAREYNLEGIDIPENVNTFCGITLEDCDKLASKCDFTVFTFDGSETSCGQISFVTSFMFGKPTICTDCVGVADYITDGENGFLVRMKDPDDLREKMLKLSEDRELYKTLSKGAQRWAQENTDPIATQKIFDELATKLLEG